MKRFVGQALLALALLIAILAGNGPLILAADQGAANPTPDSTQTAAPAATATPVAPARPVEVPPVPASAAPAPLADSPLHPCTIEATRAACAAAAAELSAYGLDVADVSSWSLVGLRRFVEAVEHLSDAFGGGGQRERRIAALARALQVGAEAGRIQVIWQAEPQDRGGSPVRGGYAADRLYFNPNTLFLDIDTPAEAAERAPALIWWNFVHELAHLWDERSAPVAAARHSTRMLARVREQQAAGATSVYPSSYAVTGGPLEAFAESVAATVTGEAADRDYYGSPRDTFVRTLLCAAVNCQP